MESTKAEPHPPVSCEPNFGLEDNVQSLSISANLDSLPDVTLVSILSLLPLKDRFTAARVCRTLYEAFLHPSLWYQMKVVLFAKIDTSMDPNLREYYVKIGVMPRNYLDIVTRFGEYFQNLTIILHDYDGMVSKECQKILKSLAAICRREDSDTPQCRLQSLHIHVNYSASAANHPAAVTAHGHALALGDLIQLVSDAYCLHSFSLHSWPRSNNVETPDILQTLVQNEKLHQLEELKLFWLRLDIIVQ